MSRLLSIDFDYFVPEDPLHDMGHCESLMFLSFVWGTRIGLLDKIKTTGDEKTFWSRVNCTQLHSAFVSETHLDAYTVLESFKDIDEVVNVDAHHDCWPLSGDNVGCDTWGTAWLNRRRKNKFTWIRPEHEVTGLGSIASPAQPRVHSTYGDEMAAHDLLQMPFDYLFICRSGCWVPPWLDEQWLRFIKEPGLRLMSLRDPPWDGLSCRWVKEDMETALKNHKEHQILIEKTFGKRELFP